MALRLLCRNAQRQNGRRPFVLPQGQRKPGGLERGQPATAQPQRNRLQGQCLAADARVEIDPGHALIHNQRGAAARARHAPYHRQAAEDALRFALAQLQPHPGQANAACGVLQGAFLRNIGRPGIFAHAGAPGNRRQKARPLSGRIKAV